MKAERTVVPAFTAFLFSGGGAKRKNAKKFYHEEHEATYCLQLQRSFLRDLRGSGFVSGLPG
jgi:hypothetical protein